MSLKKTLLIISILLIGSIVFNIHQNNINQNLKSKVSYTMESHVKEKNNINVSVTKISNKEDVIEFVIDVNGLNKDRVYTISLGSETGSSGVMLSQGNTLIRVGQILNDTQFIPYDSKLNFWTTHPKRVLNYNLLYLRIIDENNTEIYKMEVN